ncbi:hypothetical protein [Parvibaculum sedimenti]|uniref:hypothetical protein n=1 Tax=Parvibaculum sedimenti TaxID=2608632 RepID=UPI001FE8CBB0|nr:hypothetical protein [Parvibaculum sedimenti]
MSGSTERRHKRSTDVQQRVAAKATPYPRCRIFDCKKPTRAASGKGLNRLYCRSHEDHFQRHGSYTKKSYTAAELSPHRATATAWLQAHSDDIEVRNAVDAIASLMRRSGPAVEAFRLRGLPPEKRAKATWARLRQANVDPLAIIAAAISVVLAIKNDLQPDLHVEFREVQMAKAVHRMASGTHKHWERERTGGGRLSVLLHKFPISRGRVLRHLGGQLHLSTEIIRAELCSI